jgi:stage II sporulation protein R
MKKFCISLFLIGIIISAIILGGGVDGISKPKSNYQYLRIHIRANSNLDIDQTVKYFVKDAVVDFLTPFLLDVTSKQDAINKLSSLTDEIKNVTDNILAFKGFSYKSKVVIDVEKFPTRWYKDFCLEEGFYDAIIIYLGEGVGDNWWCVVYPPLCFTDTQNITYKSLLQKVIQDFISKEKK